MKTIPIVMIAAFALFVSVTQSCRTIDNTEQQRISSGDQSDTGVLQVARQVVEALTAQDGKKLASLTHPEKGIRFSPSAYVDVESDIVFTRTHIETFWTEERTYTWGLADGTGDPVNMTPSQYCREFILNRDYLSASSININNDRAVGNTHNNAASAYPDGTRVEYYMEPTSRDGVTQLDWTALRLVFEKSGSAWRLVAVIHDEWTI